MLVTLRTLNQLFLAYAEKGFQAYLALTLLCAILFIPGINNLPVTDRDEARFAQASQQMLESGDFVQISFQDTPRHKKPVGAYWIQAFAVELLGSKEERAIWPHRVPSVIAAWLAVLLTFYFGQALLDRRCAYLGAAILASCVVLIGESHLAKADASLLASVVLTQGALLKIYAEYPKGRSSFALAMLFWLGLGIGILIKGPVLPAVTTLTVIGLLYQNKERGWVWHTRPFVGVLVTALVVLPWFIAIQRATSGAFVGDALKGDILPKLAGAHESHGAWPGFYTLLSFGTFWPWSLLTIPAILTVWQKRKERSLGALLAWLLPAWVALELVPTKLPHYTLPLYPALSLLVAHALGLNFQSALETRVNRNLVRCGAILWGILSFVLAIAFIGAPLYFDRKLSWAAVIAASVIIAAVFLVHRAGYRQIPAATFLIISIIVLPLVFAAVLPGMHSFWPTAKVLEAISTLPVKAKQNFVSVGYKEPSLVFMTSTETLLADAAQAAERMNSTCEGVALVEGKELSAFNAALSSDNQLKLLANFRAFTYSKGKWNDLSIFQKERCAERR